MKTIFINEFSFFNIIIIALFRLLGFKVYFFGINKKFRKKKLIKILEKFGMIWFSYQKNYFKSFYAKNYENTQKYANKYSQEVTERVWNKDLKLYFVEQQNLRICIYQKLLHDFYFVFEILEIAQKIGNENKKTYIWAPNNLLDSKIYKDYNVKNLCPKYFTYLHIVPNFIFKFVKLIIIFLIKKIFSIFKLYQKNNKQREENKLNPEIVFFTHCGVFMRYFKKTHWYSDDKMSPFYYSNILHIDWDRKDKRIWPETNEFYNKKKIKSVYWNELKNVQNKYKFKEIISLIYLFVALIKKLDLVVAVNLFIILMKVEESKKKLSNFQNLKIALIGYELVFPQEIAVACRIKNITLVANQERPIDPIVGFQFILDKYLVFGDESKKFLLKNMIDKKMEIINTGIVRMSYHLKEQTVLRLENEEKFNFKCLVVDLKSEKDWYANGRLMTLSWNRTKLFYKNIVSLAKQNQDILFIIKSKHYDWLEISYYYDILNEIKVSSNIQILNGKHRWTTTNCIKNVDFGIIASKSLLADEILVQDKPIIILAEGDSVNSLMGYGPNIIAQNLEDLEHKVANIKLDINEYNKNLNSIRKRLFTEFKPQNFSLVLQAIYNEKNNE